jgi:hypothetical protein
MSQCPAALNIAGKGFLCDNPAPHDGWSHANREAEAIWASDLDPLPGMPAFDARQVADFKPLVLEESWLERQLWWHRLRRGHHVESGPALLGGFTGYRCSCDPDKVWSRSWV